VTPIELAPGDYWIALISGSLGTYFMAVESLDYVNEYPYFTFLSNFQSPLPHPFNGQMTESMEVLPIFAEITCGSLNNAAFEVSSIIAYPNPAHDRLYFKGMAERTTY